MAERKCRDRPEMRGKKGKEVNNGKRKSGN